MHWFPLFIAWILLIIIVINLFVVKTDPIIKLILFSVNKILPRFAGVYYCSFQLYVEVFCTNSLNEFTYIFNHFMTVFNGFLFDFIRY